MLRNRSSVDLGEARPAAAQLGGVQINFLLVIARFYMMRTHRRRVPQDACWPLLQVTLMPAFRCVSTWREQRAAVAHNRRSVGVGRRRRPACVAAVFLEGPAVRGGSWQLADSMRSKRCTPSTRVLPNRSCVGSSQRPQMRAPFASVDACCFTQNDRRHASPTVSSACCVALAKVPIDRFARINRIRDESCALSSG